MNALVENAGIQSRSRVSPGNSLEYRPDIDGLRAVAVIAVLLFHAELHCPGGFVGVDMFFVISGFLISSLILKELDDGSFSLVNFWERRIRRILPAVTVVVLGTLVAGWFLYLPADFASLGKSVVAQAALVSNIFFYQQAGYFEAGADTTPLLHTWSLAVEEQFYLIFPLFLVFLSRFRRRSRLAAIVVVAAASFASSVLGTYAYPRAAFYLLPTRAWELLLGALLAMTRGRVSVNSWIRETSAWMGLGLVACSVVYYDGSTRFPGLAAAAPCLGTALIIFSGERRLSTVGRMLAFRPVVFVGLVSYSLYLWHWPILAYSRYLLGGEGQRWPFRVALLIASAVLAILSWKYIETPFRKRTILRGRRRIFGFAGVSVATVLGLGLVVSYFAGFPWRFPRDALMYADCRDHYPGFEDTSLAQAVAAQFAEVGSREADQPINLLVWGDSHAPGNNPGSR